MSIKNFVCSKCKKVFHSKYNLERHINRKTPCDYSVELKCDKCGKEFSTKFNYGRHIKRKTDCSNNVQLEVEREKTKQQEAKIKQEEEKTKRELEKIKLKAEMELKKMEKELELKQKEIELRTLKTLEIEQAKTERKEKTPQIINNIQNITIQNNFIQYIENKYVTEKVITLNSDRFRKLIKKIFEYYIAKKIPYNCNLCNVSKTAEEFTIIFFKLLFNNETRPFLKCMFYNRDLDTFFGIFDKFSLEDNKNKEVKKIDFEKYVEPIIKPIIIELFKSISEYFKQNDLYQSILDDGYKKFIDITQGKSEILNSLENIAKCILYDDDIITEKEFSEKYENL